MASTYSNRAADCHGRPAQSGKSKGDSASQRRPARFRGKAVMDLAVALLLLLPAGAVIAILTLLVRATSKGPGNRSDNFAWAKAAGASRCTRFAP